MLNVQRNSVCKQGTFIREGASCFFKQHQKKFKRKGETPYFSLRQLEETLPHDLPTRAHAKKAVFWVLWVCLFCNVTNF